VANPLVLARPLADADLARTLEAVARDAVAPQAPATTAAPTAVGARVLLVEDDEVSQLVAHRLLEQMGCRVEVAADAEAALRQLREADFAAVLMDCQLPGLDGYEATRRIRQGDAGLRAQRTPIIALTAHASTADRDQCLAAGMNDYLSKPVDAAQLRTTVERWLPQPRREP
jgi:CheY-like chemotaxis protein